MHGILGSNKQQQQRVPWQKPHLSEGYVSSATDDQEQQDHDGNLLRRQVFPLDGYLTTEGVLVWSQMLRAIHPKCGHSMASNG